MKPRLGLTKNSQTTDSRGW